MKVRRENNRIFMWSKDDIEAKFWLVPEIRLAYAGS